MKVCIGGNDLERRDTERKHTIIVYGLVAEVQFVDNVVGSDGMDMTFSDAIQCNMVIGLRRRFPWVNRYPLNIRFCNGLNLLCSNLLSWI